MEESDVLGNDGNSYRHLPRASRGHDPHLVQDEHRGKASSGHILSTHLDVACLPAVAVRR